MSTIAMRTVIELIATAGLDRLAGVRVIESMNTAGHHDAAAAAAS